MRKEFEILGLEVVLDVIREKIKSPGRIPTGLRMVDGECLNLKDRGLHTQTTRPGRQYWKQVREFDRMLRLAGSDESDEDRDYHLSRAVEIGQQIGYMANPSNSDEVEWHCRGWRLLVRGLGGNDETETE